jgi:GntR family transcriptional repressor for pyruvate dehydrogenase complex
MKPIARIPLLDATVRSIKEYLLSGEVKVGDKMLTETKLCEMLGVGRSTIREALRMVQAMGYLEMRPGKGSYVLRTNEPEEREEYIQAVRWFVENECKVTEILEFRRFLEPYVVRLATEHITDEEIRTLTEVMDQFEKAYYDKDLIALTLLEKEFHTNIVKACRNNVFISVYDHLMEFLSNYFTRTFSIKEVADQSLEPHRRILNAVCRRDAALAEEEMRAHINLTIANMMDVVTRNRQSE